MDKKRENTNRIEMGSVARAKTSSQQEKASVRELPQGQKRRGKVKEPESHMRSE